jgi:hypothetical protein
MPYIKKADRYDLDRSTIRDVFLTSPGELNYLFTRLAQRYLTNNGINYQSYNDIIGALEGCKLELYRRAVSPYEDLKIKENGDV